MLLVQGLLPGFKPWGRCSGLVYGKNVVTQKEFSMKYVVVFCREPIFI
jgi:hypothetical protein